jgi:iron complex outermembrane recepter protein
MKKLMAAVVGATLALCTIEANADATPGDRKVALTIESTSLATALDKWAQQSGFQIFVDWEVTRNLVAPSLNGTYTAQQALDVLLANTPLTSVWINDKAVSIRKKAPPTVPAALQRTGLEGQQSTPVTKFSGDSAGKRQSASEDLAVVPAARGERLRENEVKGAEEVLVTGTRIRGSGQNGSQVIVISREQIERSGADSTTQLMRALPQNFGGGQNENNIESATANSSANGQNVGQGTSINLRGLGSEATLVLLNGRRLATSGLQDAVDISSIPLSAVERVEVMLDSGSAVYGADAVGGVVNFVLRTDYAGAETSVSVGGTSDGGDTRLIAQSLGAAWGSGQTLIALEYADREPISTNERSYSSTINPPMTLVPGSERSSVLLSLDQALGDRYGLFVQGLATRRSVEATTTFPGLSFNTNSSTVRQYTGTAGLNVDWSESWRSTIALTAAKDWVEYQTTSLFFPSTRSALARDYTNRIAEAELNSEGPLLHLPGGDLRAAFGGGYREQHVQVDVNAPTRRVKHVYGEIQLPFISASNARPFAHELTLNLEGRYEEYSDFGSAFSPKVGVTFAPVQGFTLRGTWNEAFRAPKPFNLYGLNTVIILNVPPGFAPGAPFTAFYRLGGNPDLAPEESESYTVGFDIAPPQIEGLQVSATYFDVDYTDRILTPPGNVFSGFSDPAFSSLITPNPSVAELQSIIAGAALVQNLSGGVPLSNVRYLVDRRYNNIASVRTTGVDFQATWLQEMSSASIDWILNVSKRLAFDVRTLPTSNPISQLDLIYQTPSLRARGGATLAHAGWSLSAFVNYIHGYDNTTVTPREDVSSWTTVDSQLAYAFPESAPVLLSNSRIALSILNAFDKDPPFARLAVPVGYDTTNADPRGRFVSLGLQKRW